MEASRRNKIIISLVISLMLTLLVTRTIFFVGIPKINAEKVRRIVKNTKDNLTIFKNTFAYKISSNKIDYSQTLGDSSAVDYKMIAIAPTQTVLPTMTGQINLTPTLVPVEPTNTPIPTPTEIILAKISPTLSLKPPTAIPTVKKKPTPTVKKPSPTTPPSIGTPVKISNPLDQPYYNPSIAYKCYTPEKFIEVYANDVTSTNCYQSVQTEVEKNITSVSILGHSIQVHKKAYPYFKAVADELSKNSVAKAYKINSIGAYNFRCNVNASNSSDLCNKGCVLSTHAFGISVDINWDENCNGCSTYTMPMEIVDIFESYGFRWGGRYKSIFGSTIDPMHFEFLYDLCKDLN
ncbi:MAG: M15 family metallopeptidase [Patescibacteria group bacterium]